ncbi:hypothetical protein K439DRAFT_1284357, partial [Ramaria rubella]
LLYLPPYSPDLNPIEESFSVVKAWLRRHKFDVQNSVDAIAVLQEACKHVTAEMARAFFKNSGY